MDTELNRIVSKYPIMNDSWLLVSNVQSLFYAVHNITKVDINNGYELYSRVREYKGVCEYFYRTRVDRDTVGVFNYDPWNRPFAVYGVERVKNNVRYECIKIDGWEGGNDVWVMTTTVEGIVVYCMDVFENIDLNI